MTNNQNKSKEKNRVLNNRILSGILIFAAASIVVACGGSEAQRRLCRQTLWTGNARWGALERGTGNTEL